MKISRNDINDLNSVITISVEQDDIQDKVDKTLKDYRKNANIPGFRQGHAPMSMIKSKYEDAVKFDEINKLLQNSIQEYIKEQDLVLLGQPLPETKEELDLNSFPIDFNYEIGISPKVAVDLSKISVPKYEIKVSDEDIDKSIDSLRKQYGSSEETDTVEENSFMKVDVKAKDDFFREITLWVDQTKNPKEFEGKKVGDVVKVNAQDLYKDPHNLEYQLGLTHSESHTFNEELEITIKEIKIIKPAEINEEFFQKAFPNEDVKNEEEARAKLKEETQEYYQRESDNQMLNNVTEQLLETVQFDLPDEFLKKFIKNNQEEPMTDEQVEEEYEKSKKALRYQLIEGQILSDNKVQITPEQIMETAKADVKNRLKSYGYSDVSDEDAVQYAQQMLQNEQQVRQISNQLLQQNLADIFKENVKLEPKEVSFDEFIEIVKSSNDKEMAENQ